MPASALPSDAEIIAAAYADRVRELFRAFAEAVYTGEPEREAVVKFRRALMSARRVYAAAMLGVAEESGSFGAWLGAWPGTDIVGLWDAIAGRFSQMGGNSGPMFLRMVGKDTFVLSHSVVAGLKRWAEMTSPPKNKADRAAAQACFNAWAEESGRPLSQLSLILALSVDE